MNGFDLKTIEASIKDELIKIATTTGMLFCAKSSKRKAIKTSLDVMNSAGTVCGRILVKYSAVYKKWIKDRTLGATVSPAASLEHQRFLAPGSYKISSLRFK